MPQLQVQMPNPPPRYLLSLITKSSLLIVLARILMPAICNDVLTLAPRTYTFMARESTLNYNVMECLLISED